MKSMTGYGRGTAVLGGHTLTVQVSSVNRKTLDLAIKLPEEGESLEPAVGDQVRKVAARGRVSVVIELTGENGAGELVWDEGEIGAVLDRLSDLAEAEDAAPVVRSAVADALRGFGAMRAKEGEALLIDFITRLNTLRTHM